MCPPFSGLKVMRSNVLNLKALTGERAFTHCTGGHITFLGQSDLISPTIKLLKTDSNCGLHWKIDRHYNHETPDVRFGIFPCARQT